MISIKNLWFIALVTLVLVGCQKDQEITTEQNTEFSTILEETSAHTHIHTATRRCGSTELMELKLQDPTFKAAYDTRVQAFQNYVRNNPSNSRAACSNPKILPVAVHYQGISNPNKACLISLAQAQINVINRDFRGTNSDISQWKNTASAAFPGVVNGESCFEFCLATQNHPSGFSLSNGQPAVTFNQTNGDQINQWAGYINIIVNDADGNLGYAPLGGSGNGDGVVINKTAFGVGAGCGTVKPAAPFNLGRTLTHEMGHYLNLDHLWGNGGCNSDDLISDTPGQTDANHDCPNLNTTSCGSKDLHMSYMDYTNDACMYMFTEGQTSRAESWVNSGLFNRLKTAATVCGAGGTTGDTGGGDTTGDTDGGGTTGDTGGGGTTGDTGDGGDTGGGTACATPTDSNAAQNDNTSFTVSWAGNATDYQLRYRISGGWTIKNLTTTSFKATGLTSGATYQYRVRAKCNGKWTTQTAIKTITLTVANSGACDKPSGLAAQATTNGFTASWNTGTNVTTYQLRYRKSGTSAWTAKNATTTSYEVTGLTSGATYQYRVRARCDNGKWTAYAATKTVTIESAGGGNTGGGGTASTSKITMKVTLDDYGSETIFAIEKADGTVVKQYGPFADGQAGKVITRNITLPTGGYIFVIYDDYGDGICCSEGAGKWQLLRDGSTIKTSNGRFGYWEEYDFSVGSARLSGDPHRVDPKDFDKLVTKSKPTIRLQGE